MNIDDYQKQVKPRSKRSILDIYTQEIFTLKQNGYTYAQIREWLLSNEISVSIEAIRKFIKTRSKTLTTEKKIGEESPKAFPPPVDASTAASAQDSKRREQADKLRQLVEEQRQEASDKLFKHDKTGKNI